MAASTAFSSLTLSPTLLEVVKELGYERMTPIQAESIPHLLKGRDFIGQSKTGSGKTAAFSLPILENLQTTGRRRLQALVLCPTRELCTQVAREIRKLGRRIPGLQVLIVAGGSPLFPQLSALSKGVHIVVGTPGRVMDHLGRQSLDLRGVKTVVLDEADRMLDMGFQDDMETILRDTPRDRQTVLFSATFPKEIDSISRAYQRNPIKVIVETAPAEAPKIQQIAYEVDVEEKTELLLHLLREKSANSAIVFCNLKATVVDLEKKLAQAGASVAAIHGDLDQYDRDRVMAKFRNRSTRILVATDVAARGLDVEDLDVVYNFDLPQTSEVYVHRVGRTGRAGKTGVAFSLVTPKQRGRLDDLEAETGFRILREKTPALESANANPSMRGMDQEAAMETLYIAGGRKDKVRPGDILGALTGEAGGLSASDVGKIEIHDRFSYVAVSKRIARDAFEALSEGRIKGRKFRIHLVR